MNLFLAQHVNILDAGLELLTREQVERALTYIGHNYIGHDYIGHDYIGHNYIGHNRSNEPEHNQ